MYSLSKPMAISFKVLSSLIKLCLKSTHILNISSGSILGSTNSKSSFTFPHALWFSLMINLTKSRFGKDLNSVALLYDSHGLLTSTST
ncbi:hypothetical protein SS1G_08278 [Sclerotinia sclerotiorum 1980 UF-70]|uniref:Uncharacterized protein n=1 Tax=Sclerotinia sclerotiorum (strain ATCC 18683 / 1980 / Ss-1) TaxID=665079 RepID=A7ESH3_SCLS1|nr:hypothetical protein SS1G_08278 [Sclerotinia sclerotiorum 1980 UF-70]EDN92415.1 hypothetical protein SS1G_08278 [Sclerotinia sclerotiorum 1980 UF-70]